MNLPDGYFLQKKKYQLTNTIGQGGFGITYAGVWNTIVKGGLGAMKTKVSVCIKEYFFKDYCYREEKTYAVKVHSETGEKLFDKFKEKLIKEANILSDVHHPYIVNVLEVFEENNTAYIVMEYIKGDSLKYLLDKNGVLPENKIIKYTHQIGNALNFVHRKNIVHLDIKPSNILIDKDDNARLIDFGVSKRYDINQHETSTTTLTLSKGFASIEQYDDEGTQIFSPCPDIYSLGATMYYLLTGIIPIESILRATKQLPLPSSYNSKITQKTEKTIVKAMAVKPENRYPSVKDMLADLDAPPYKLTDPLSDDVKPQTEEQTEVLTKPSLKTTGNEDDESTVVVPNPSNKTLPEKKHTALNKKIKRRTLLSALILLLAFLGYSLFTYFRDFTNLGILTSKVNKFQPFVIDTPFVKTPDSTSVQENTLDDTPADSSLDIQPNSSVPEETVNAGLNAAPTPEIQRESANPRPPENNPRQPIEDNAKQEQEYKELISSTKEKINNNRYKEALSDAKKALEKKVTDEALSLIRLCKEKEEERKLKERLDKYIIFENIDFGALRIVRKKTTHLYGAIDKNGEERIPCKYITVDKVEGGRAFMRSDNLYDIYNMEGNAVGTGLNL